MDLTTAVKSYINRMVEQTSGVKVLLLDAETVSREPTREIRGCTHEGSRMALSLQGRGS